jgi:pilus assembly protein CpaB
LLGSFLTYRWAKQQIQPGQSVHMDVETVAIAVASSDLGWGTQLTTDKVKLTPYLKNSLPPGFFSSLESLQNRVVIVPVRQDEPILENKLAPADITTGGVSAIVRPGYRAVAVKGDMVLGLSGLIRPGNRVDVLVSYVDQRADREITKVVLENILVLATGAEVIDKAKGAEETQPVDVYTLEVTPEDGEKLALAATQGKLHFALRNAMDTETVLTRGATMTEALTSFRTGAKAGKPAARQGPSVEVIRGTNVTKEQF